jgi:hypothetical protein
VESKDPLYNTTWRFNNTLVGIQPQYASVYYNSQNPISAYFVIDNITYNKIGEFWYTDDNKIAISRASNEMGTWNAGSLTFTRYEGFASVTVYKGAASSSGNGSWVNQAYRTMTIKQKITDTNGELLYKYLRANAEKIEYTPEIITFTIDGVSYQAESNMTFFEWCNSKYNTLGATCGANADWVKVGDKFLSKEYIFDLDGMYSIYPNTAYKLVEFSGGGIP